MRFESSVLRDILAVTEQPGVVSLAGGLPAPESFPVELLRDACDTVLRETPAAALQYAGSEGFAPLREWVADDLRRQGMAVQARQVLITSGSQQGLDIAARVLLDEGARVAVTRPCYPGALQAFAPMAPSFVELAQDDVGVLPDALSQLAARGDTPRIAYLTPTFANPTGSVLDEARRDALVQDAMKTGVPLLEDDPYRALWCDTPPPAPLAARWPEGTIYLGSFSKVLAPGLRLGYAVLPDALWPSFLRARQGMDLHSSGFGQRIAHRALTDTRFPAHRERVRSLYRMRRDAMAAALRTHLPATCTWQEPAGGMFFWLRLPAGQDAQTLFEQALARDIAFVPGQAFFAHSADARTLRLSYVTVLPAALERAVATLGRLIDQGPTASGEASP